jgi:hypothetical protein
VFSFRLMLVLGDNSFHWCVEILGTMVLKFCPSSLPKPTFSSSVLCYSRGFIHCFLTCPVSNLASFFAKSRNVKIVNNSFRI